MKRTLTFWKSTRSDSWSWLALFIWVVEAALIFMSMLVVLVRSEFQEKPLEVTAR